MANEINGNVRLISNEAGGPVWVKLEGRGSVSLVLERDVAPELVFGVAPDGKFMITKGWRLVTFLTKGTLYRHKIPADIGFVRTDDGRILVK